MDQIIKISERFKEYSNYVAECQVALEKIRLLAEKVRSDAEDKEPGMETMCDISFLAEMILDTVHTTTENCQL